MQQGAGEGRSFPTRPTSPPAPASCPMPRRCSPRPTSSSRSRSRSRRSTAVSSLGTSCSPFFTWPPIRNLTRALVDSGATCLAYETVETADGRRPLLAPMSEIAGRLAPQVGAYFLERMSGGKGKLLGGATGVKAANVVILGAGIAGTNAAIIASGMGAHTKVLDIDLDALAHGPAAIALRRDPAQRPTHHRGRGRSRPTWSSARSSCLGRERRCSYRRTLVRSHAAGVGHRRPEHRPRWLRGHFSC